MSVAEEKIAHAELVGGGETTLHSHAGGGGGANVKSGTKVCTIGANSVTFTTAFSSTPRVVLIGQDAALALRDALWVVRSVTTTGFDFEVDAGCTIAWIATDAGNS